MGKFIKWLIIIILILVVLVVAAVVGALWYVDGSVVSKQVSDKTGRPFSLDKDMDMTYYPWAGFKLSNVSMGNPSDYKEKTFVSMKSMEVRVKLLPLLSKNIQVKRLVIDEPHITLIKKKDGAGNWEGIGGEQKAETKESGGMPSLGGFYVGECAIRNGLITFIDESTGETHKIENLNFEAKDISLDKPLDLTFSALLDQKPVSAKGSIGLSGGMPGKGTVPLSFVLKALDQLEVKLEGNVVDPASDPKFDMTLNVAPFSPKKLLASIGEKLPMETADPNVLEHVAVAMKIKGDPKAVNVSDGLFELDDSKLTFSASVKEPEKPNVQFEMALDKIDADRYLPPPSEKPVEEKPAPAPSEKKQPDFTPLRKLVLDGTVKVGELKANKATVSDVLLKIKGKDGVFNLEPLSLKLYEGDLAVNGTFNLSQDVPVNHIEVDAKGIQVQPLLKDLQNKDFLAGTTNMQMKVDMKGMDPEEIKKSLNGQGEILITDGAIVGIDLAGMVRNAKASFGLGKKTTERPKTDFSELRVPFTLTDGVFETPGTAIMSPLLRVTAMGKANLVTETLDMRVEPKAVASLKGQGDTMDRAGIMVPVIVDGTFQSPSFRPDLESMMKAIVPDIKAPEDIEKAVKGLSDTIKQPGELGKALEKALPIPIPGKQATESEQQQSQPAAQEPAKGLEDAAKGLMKSLPFGKKK